jgi:transcription initiation factor IIE alpha subunit
MPPSSIKKLHEEVEKLKAELQQIKGSQEAQNFTLIGVDAAPYEHAAIGVTVISSVQHQNQPILSSHTLFIQHPDDPAEVDERVQKALLNALSTALVSLSTIQDTSHAIQIYLPNSIFVEDLATTTGIREELGSLCETQKLSPEIIDYLEETRLSLAILSRTNRKSITLRSTTHNNLALDRIKQQCSALIQQVIDKIDRKKEQSIVNSVRCCPNTSESTDQSDQD